MVGNKPCHPFLFNFISLPVRRLDLGAKPAAKIDFPAGRTGLCLTVPGGQIWLGLRHRNSP
jgi:hypothetical protein